MSACLLLLNHDVLLNILRKMFLKTLSLMLKGILSEIALRSQYRVNPQLNIQDMVLDQNRPREKLLKARQTTSPVLALEPLMHLLLHPLGKPCFTFIDRFYDALLTIHSYSKQESKAQSR